jgi:hypothetical protein
MKGGTTVQNTEPRRGPPAREEQLSLDKAATHLLEECRMVLPGIQALLGFQMIAVFSQRFATALTRTEQRLHLAAILLVVSAIILVMAPAAYHRHAEPRAVSEQFVRVSSRFLLSSMVPLGFATSFEVYLVGRVVLNDVLAASVIAACVIGATFVVWWVLPWVARSRSRIKVS